MRRSVGILLCLSLAGIFLLSACQSPQVDTPVEETAFPSSTNIESPAITSTTANPTSTRTAKPTQTVPVPTKAATKTATPTVTNTGKVDELAVEIDSLFDSLFADLEDTELILETEIP